MINNIIDDYNTHVDNTTYFPVHNLTMNTSTDLTCTIVGFMKTPYEKYPDFTTQVIMEYGWFTDYLADNLPFPLNTDSKFKDFVKG